MFDEQIARNRKIINQVVYRQQSCRSVGMLYDLSHTRVQQIIHRWARQNGIDHGHVAVIIEKAKGKWPERFGQEAV